MGPELLLLLLLEVALFCPVTVLYPTTSHRYALFANLLRLSCNRESRKAQPVRPVADNAAIFSR